MDIVSWTFGSLSDESNKPIFIDADKPAHSISASQARRHVRQLIAGLRAKGLQRGSTVCILTLSSIYYPLFFLAVVGAGARVAGGNPGHTVYELENLLTTCNVEFIITETSLLEKTTSAASVCAIDLSRIYVCDGHEESPNEPRCWRSLLQYGETDWDVLNEYEAAMTPTAYYATSGTTGAPKFAAVSHSYQVTSGEYIEIETRTKPYAVSRLVSLPLMHAFAAPLVHFAAIRCGTPTYILPRFSVSAFVDAVSTHGITDFPVVPSMLIALNGSPFANRQAFATVREVMCAGAPLSTSLAASFSELLTAKFARLVQLYGSTEAGWISSTPWLAANNFPRKSSTTSPKFSLHTAATPTIGSPCIGYQMRLLHPQSELPVTGSCSAGILQVKGPHPFLYYVGAEEATRGSFTDDGWLKTGDVATRDSQGHYYIIDREKDMIKVRGWQVAPAEIEAVLLAHHEIQDCAVIGVQDIHGSSGEVPWAFIELRPGITEPDTQSLKGWIRERLAGYKIPATITIVEQIPRNPAGKILRRIIRGNHLKTTAAGEPFGQCDQRNEPVAAAKSQDTETPSPQVVTDGDSVLPAWLKHGGVRSWPATNGRSLRTQNYSTWKRVLALLAPAAIGLGLYLWRTNSAYDFRGWWTY